MTKPIDETKSALLRRNVILLDTEVDGSMVHYIYACIAELDGRGSPQVEVRIFTNGGSVHAGLDVFDALRKYGGKKIGVVYAYARSMGAIILQACDERVCLEHASILIHHVNSQAVSLDVLDDPKRLKKLHAGMQSDQRSLYDILMGRTGKSEEEIRSTCRKDEDMNATEALAFGLIDRIEPFKVRETPTTD